MPRPAREPNLRLRMLIEEAGFSHKGLARRVNDLGQAKGISGMAYDHSSVIRWLKGEHPRQPIPALIAEVFSMSLGREVTAGDLGFPAIHELPTIGLRFATSWRDTIEVVTTLWRSDLERRQFIVDSVFAAGAYATSAIRWLTAPPARISLPVKSIRQVGRADVEAIREVTQTFYRLDNLFGGGRARLTVVRYLHDEVGPLLHDGRYSETVGKDLFSAAAELTRLAGWMAYDLEQHGLAQRYLVQALRLAREADNYALGGEILAGMSHQAVYLRQADDGLDLARAAYESATKAGIAHFGIRIPDHAGTRVSPLARRPPHVAGRLTPLSTYSNVPGRQTLLSGSAILTKHTWLQSSGTVSVSWAREAKQNALPSDHSTW